MCRMLGIKNFNLRRHEEILRNFLDLARNGRVLPGDSPGHLDGWGIAYYANGAPAVQKSGRSILAEQKLYWETLETVGRSRILLVHLRKSSWPGTSLRAHTHPFTSQNFSFAHNGTIRDYQKILDGLPGREQLRNVLDSEVYFRYIMTLLSPGLEKAFRQAVRHIRKKNTYSSLNCLLSDGRRLYGYREYRRNPEYYSLYHASLGGARFISSEPVSLRVPWKMIPGGKMVIF
jgi:predicted glutamine amidotransferase